jgi:SAM-dependent methyltransferase
MSTDDSPTTATSAGVIDYYSRNWERIANCYALGDNGLPVDPAWYRRRLYGEFLDRMKPASVLDIGCGGGWTVLDALERGIAARGIEPVAPLQQYASRLLAARGFDSSLVDRDDLAALDAMPSESQDCIALLSVLPHVPRQRWAEVHRQLSRVLRPGGCLIAAYRNELFDLYTFNSFTVEFYDTSLWAGASFADGREALVAKLKQLMTNPDVPGPYFTAAVDKTFGQLERIKSNPLQMPSFLSGLGLHLNRTRYYHFHCVPPLMMGQVEAAAAVNHDMELTMADDWRGHFMAAMFLVEAVRR